jgi:hypothetical protein
MSMVWAARSISESCWIYGSRPLMAAQRRVIVMELVQRRKRARGGDAKDCAVIVIAPTHKG